LKFPHHDVVKHTRHEQFVDAKAHELDWVRQTIREERQRLREAGLSRTCPPCEERPCNRLESLPRWAPPPRCEPC
jgi:hypothetical protein